MNLKRLRAWQTLISEAEKLEAEAKKLDAEAEMTEVQTEEMEVQEETSTEKEGEENAGTDENDTAEGPDTDNE